MKKSLTTTTLMLALLLIMPLQSLANRNNDTILNYAYENGKIKILSGNGELYPFEHDKDGYKYIYYLFTKAEYLHLSKTDVKDDNSHYCLATQDPEVAIWYNLSTKKQSAPDVKWSLRYEGEDKSFTEYVKDNPNKCLWWKDADKPVQLLFNVDNNRKKKADNSTVLLYIMPPFSEKANPEKLLQGNEEIKLNYGGKHGKSLNDFQNDTVFSKKSNTLNGVEFVITRSDRAVINSITANGVVIPVKDSPRGPQQIVAKLDNIPIERGKNVKIKIHYQYFNHNDHNEKITQKTFSPDLPINWERAKWWRLLLIIFAILVFIIILAIVLNLTMNKKKRKEDILNYAYENGEIKILSGNGELYLYRFDHDKGGYKSIYYLFTKAKYLHLRKTDVKDDNSYYCLATQDPKVAVWYDLSTKKQSDPDVKWSLRYEGKDKSSTEYVKDNPNKCLWWKNADKPVQLLFNVDNNREKKADNTTVQLYIMSPFSEKANPNKLFQGNEDIKLNYGGKLGKSLDDFKNDTDFSMENDTLNGVECVITRSDRAVIDSITANGVVIPVKDSPRGPQPIVAKLDNIPIERGKDVNIEIHYRYFDHDGRITPKTISRDLPINLEKANVSVTGKGTSDTADGHATTKSQRNPKNLCGKLVSLFSKTALKKKEKELRAEYGAIVKAAEQARDEAEQNAQKKFEEEFKKKESELRSEYDAKVKAAEQARDEAEQNAQKKFEEEFKKKVETLTKDCNTKVKAAQDAQQKAEKARDEAEEKAKKEFEEQKRAIEADCDAKVLEAQKSERKARNEKEVAIKEMQKQRDEALKQWTDDRDTMLGKLQSLALKLKKDVEQMDRNAFNGNCGTIRSGAIFNADRLCQSIESGEWKNKTTGECFEELRADYCQLLDYGTDSWVNLLGRLYSYMSVAELRQQLLSEGLSFELVSDAFDTLQAFLASIGIIVLNCSPGYDSGSDPVTSRLFKHESSIDRITNWLGGNEAVDEAIPNHGQTVYDFGQLAYFTTNDLQIHKGSVIYHN